MYVEPRISKLIAWTYTTNPEPALPSSRSASIYNLTSFMFVTLQQIRIRPPIKKSGPWSQIQGSGPSCKGGYRMTLFSFWYIRPAPVLRPSCPIQKLSIPLPPKISPPTEPKTKKQKAKVYALVGYQSFWRQRNITSSIHEGCGPWECKKCYCSRSWMTEY